MKAIILAAGYGKRIGKLTETLPKPLIPLANKPILQHLVKNLAQIGITDMVIAVGHLKEQIISFIDHFQKKGIKIKIKIAEDFRKGPLYSFNACIDEIIDEHFILIPADFLIEPSALLDLLQKTREPKLILAFDDQKVNTPHSLAHLSINGAIRRVLGITSNVVGTASEVKLLLPLLICNTHFHSYIKKSLELGHTKVIETINLYLQQKNVVTAVRIQKGNWFDLDTVQDFLLANSFLLDQLNSKNQAFPSPADYDSQQITLKPPILIGNNCQIAENCIIGPNVFYRR